MSLTQFLYGMGLLAAVGLIGFAFAAAKFSKEADDFIRVDPVVGEVDDVDTGDEPK